MMSLRKGRLFYFVGREEVVRRGRWPLPFVSLRQSEWAEAYYRSQRAQGSGHHRALQALGAKWLKIIFVMWEHHRPYGENYHLANMARQRLRQAAWKQRERGLTQVIESLTPSLINVPVFPYY